ncbi:MAG: L-threonylcarbamoyladenylate synthase [Bacteroidota bacterium]
MEDFFKEIEYTLAALEKGDIILYPTDTVWGIGCDATRTAAVAKIYALKKRPDSKALICLVSDVEMLGDYIEAIPEKTFELIAGATRPMTIIYTNPVGLAKNLVAEDNTIAIRVAKDAFCSQLIKRFGKPVVSTSANLSGYPTPQSFKEIGEEILKGADYVVNLYHDKMCKHPSSIIKLEKNGEVTVVRS